MPPRAWGEVAMPISWAWLYVFFLLASSADQFVGGLSIFDGFGHPGCMSQHLNAAGLPTIGIDRRTNDPKHDGSSLSGVQYIIACLARLAPNSLVWLAPPCCSWIWISRSVHGRSSSEPLGFLMLGWTTTTSWPSSLLV
jgi:hypothetical protein